MSSAVEIIEKIRRAGVIGCGGAGFPTYVKLQRPCEFYIANGAECEPLLQSDQKTMELYADEILAGLRIAMALTGAKQGIFAIKEKYHQSVSAVESALFRLNMTDTIKIHLLKDFYPVGDEQILVYETTGRIVPESGLPLNVGCVVNNVTTLRQIFFAVQDIPVTHRFVSVLGEVARPQVLNLPIGTLIEDVIQLCGGATVEDYVVIDGGPMMGRLSPRTVRKTTSGLLVLPSDHRLIRQISLDRTMQILRTMSVCDQCFACTEVCPRYQLGHRLEPHLVMRDISNGIGLERSVNFLQMAYLCCHCDVCRVWGCPVELAPGRVMEFLKQDLQRRRLPNPFREHPVSVRSSRDGVRPPVSQLIKRLGLDKYVLPLEVNPVPIAVARVRLELHQHIGKPATPVVKKGDRINTAQMVADVTAAELGCPIHSPIDGYVSEIADQWIEIRQ